MIGPVWNRGRRGLELLEQLKERATFVAQRELIRRRFRWSVGYTGNFEHPRSYQEKIQYRKLYGNHAFYAEMADKYRVRRYVAERVGEQVLVPLLGVYERLERAVFETLPQQFIIKANHGCKWHEIVWDKRQLDIDRSVRHFNRLMRRRYGWKSGERHYSLIEPKILIEQLLVGPDGGVPYDFSFLCYHSPQGFDFCFAIAAPDGRAAQFLKDWTLLDSELSPKQLAPRLRPENFDTMVQVARALSAPFDFVRVDLYTVGERVYFGELTCTPHGGFGRIDNLERQHLRDRMWRLDTANPLLYGAPSRN